ncbi:hypothetical protein [Bacteriophage sp.]|nr:hypothetical protein [Bacteriophage sp.]UOF80103.1 hypothetical protein [Bacteriophage sp.]
MEEPGKLHHVTIRAIWRDLSGHGVRSVEKAGPPTEVLNWLGRMPHVSGPNGPVTQAIVVVGQEKVGPFEAARRLKLVALVRPGIGCSEVFAGVVAENDDGA